jgi:peroxiredoxin
MRKFAIVLLAVLFFGCANENQFSIDGSVKGASEDQWIYLERKGVNSNTVLDSARLEEDGTFEFELETEYPRFYDLTLENQFATLLIQPGEDVRFQTHTDRFHDYTVEGSPGSKDVKMLDHRLRQTKSRLDSLARKYNQAGENISPQQMEEINEKYRAIVNQQRDSSVAYIISHLNSLASIMALYQKINDDLFVLYKNSDLQYIKLVADSLQARYPQSQHVKALVANKEDLMTRYKNLELQQTINQLGEVDNYPGIELPNLQGDTVSLQELDDKMILLSFWASWSKQSIQRNMELMSIYKRYHDQGFEIYQVSLDQSREQWRKAVEFDQLPWINVSDLKGLGSYAAQVYNVQEVPTDYLIHQERGILVKNPNKQALRRQLSIALD